MHLPIRAILFDLDGTLLDTAPDMAEAANRVLADYDQAPLSDEQIKANTSYGARGLLTAGFGSIPAHLDADQLRREFLNYYQQNICEGTSVYRGINTVLAYLEAHQIPWGIMTNKPEFLTELLLPFFPELLQAQVVVCGDTLAVAKPHPEPLLHASELLGIPHTACAYVGDIEKDMIAANAARMHGLVAGWGYIGQTHSPEAWQAREILPTPEALIDMLEQQRKCQ